MELSASLTAPPVSALWRTLLLGLLCQGLAGCMTISTQHATNLPEPPVAQDAAVPVQVAFIVHLQGAHATDFGENPQFYDPREGLAWGQALSALAVPEHILIAGPEARPQMTLEFAEFCRTHPVVDITPIWDRESATFLKRFAYVGAMLVDLSSLGLIPLPAIAPYRAQFRLTLPEATGGAAPGELSYAFDRKLTLPPLYLIPQGDEYSTWLIPPCSGCQPILLFQVDRTDWRVDEKRRLLGQFLHDVRPQLEQYARGAQSSVAPAGAGGMERNVRETPPADR